MNDKGKYKWRHTNTVYYLFVYLNERQAEGYNARLCKYVKVNWFASVAVHCPPLKSTLYKNLGSLLGMRMIQISTH
jgi:hypothetical protein